MLLLYRALFLGFLRYSTPVLSNTCKTNLRALQAIQGQALRTCLGLPRGASTVASIALAKDHTISEHIALDSLRIHIRHLSRIPQHHLAAVPLQRPLASFSKVLAAHQLSIPTQFSPAARPSSPLWCLRSVILKPHCNVCSLPYVMLNTSNYLLQLRIPSDLRRCDATLLCRLWLGVAFTGLACLSRASWTCRTARICSSGCSEAAAVAQWLGRSPTSR